MTVATDLLPVNYRKQDHSATAVAEAVAYALCVADGYLGQWTTYGPAAPGTAAQLLAGVRLLEIGPGPSLGVPVLLACAGAQVAVADRFPATWDRDFHAPFFEELLRRVEGRDWNLEPIRQLLRADAFVETVLASYAVPAEEVDRIGRTFDLIFTNAVLEHVQDLQAAAASLARVSARGAHGFHQVDLRDHRDFSRPLEFLTVSDAEFADIRRASFCECGGHWRASDVAAAFTSFGFRVQTVPNLWASQEYLADVRPRLRPGFAGRPESDLATLSALFVVSSEA